jgi:hypothetical protein
MKKYRLLLIAYLVIINFTNCENDELTENPIENPDTGQDPTPDPNPSTINYDFGNDVNRNFIGIVVNEDNQPLASATVTIGSVTTQTDLNGMFVINNVTVKENFAYIKASLLGYFDGSESIIPLEEENVIKIMLRERFTVVRDAGEAFAIEYGFYSIGFSGDFVTEAGTPYTGPVNIAFSYLNPTDENLNELMPGMLLGQDTDGEANLLETYGMLTVELTGSSNQKLQIASDSELKFPIVDEQLANAPNTIPLWYFDEEAGYWIQEGTATKVGNQYIGNVSHFTPWNVDIPIPLAKIDLTVLNQNNVPLLGVDIYAYPEGEISPRIFTTNKDGKACGFVPANSVITLEIEGYCDEVISTQTVGPFVAGSTNIIPPIIITQMMAPQSEIIGTLKQCDNTNVTNGYVILRNGNDAPIFYTTTNGDFEFNVFICNGETTFTLEGYDADNLQSTGQNSYTFVTPTTEVGDLMTCNDVDEYILYTLNSQGTSSPTERAIYAPFEVTIEPNRLFIEISDIDFLMDFNPEEGTQFLSTGIYEAASDFIFRHSVGQPPYINWKLDLGNDFSVLVNQMTFNIIEMGEVGEYLTFTFEGQHVNLYIGEVGFEQTISGTARVRRDQ